MRAVPIRFQAVREGMRVRQRYGLSICPERGTPGTPSGRPPRSVVVAAPGIKVHEGCRSAVLSCASQACFGSPSELPYTLPCAVVTFYLSTCLSVSFSWQGDEMAVLPQLPEVVIFSFSLRSALRVTCYPIANFGDADLRNKCGRFASVRQSNHFLRGSNS